MSSVAIFSSLSSAEQRLDRRLDVAAAGIRLDVAVGDAERHGRRQRDGARLVGAAEREGLHEAVARLDHVGRAFDALLGEQRRLQAFARRVAGVQPLDVAAAVDEGEQAGGARCRNAERMAELVGGQAAQLAGRHGGAERPDRAGRMKAALAQVGRAGARERDRGLVARHDRLDQRRAAGILRVGDAERRRDHDVQPQCAEPWR